MPATRTRQEIEIEGRRLALTNIQKVLFPSGFTKGQVIHYYVEAADFVLRHLKARPITLKRYPDGTTGPHFYEKDAPKYTPEWIRTYPVPRRTGEADIRYIVIDDLPTLVWSANAANLELHPFLHRAPHLQRPTTIVFDLDPGEGADLLSCAEVAFMLKNALESGGIQCFPKVSGSKGMQLYAPLNTAVTYAETQPYAHDLAQRLEREHSRLVVSEMAKARRKGKVFIDWSQNSDFKTTVCVYSLRAKQSTPYISMPVTWQELRRALRERETASLYWEPDAAIQRMRKLGDLFEPVQRLKQKLRAPKSTGARAKRSAVPSDPH